MDNVLVEDPWRAILLFMRFQDLPRDWAQRPITDPDLFEGVIDLVVTERSRALGAIYVLLCHPGGRLMQPLCLSDAGSPEDCEAGIVREAPPVTDVLDALTSLLLGVGRGRGGHVVLAIARPGTVRPTRRDRALRAGFERVCTSSRFELLGVAIAGTGAVAALPSDLSRDAA